MNLEAKDMKTIVRKSVDIKRKDGKIIISTINPDRGGDRVNPKGCKFENYMKNPVVMWLHDYKGQTPAAGIPIARCTGLTITDNDIVSEEPQFLEGDPFAQRVKNAWEQGFIKTASIGFAPLTEPVPNEFNGLDFESWEMLEWSLVPIPMNADAMRIAKAAGFEELIDMRNAPVMDLTISQPEVKDELDYCLSLIKQWNLSPENVELVKAIYEELAKRFSGDDIPVEDTLKELAKLFDEAKSKFGG